MDAGCNEFLGFCEAKTRARDRSGIFAKQKLERIARSPPPEAAGMRPSQSGVYDEFPYSTGLPRP
jgi:hypothetical protein